MAFRAISPGVMPAPVTVCPKQAALEFFRLYPWRKACRVALGTHASGEFIAEPWRKARRYTRGNVTKMEAGE